MGLFFNSDINKLYLGSTEVKEVYIGSEQVWPASLPVGTTFNFDYTGDVQSVELPRGKYKLQCWGAQGGNVTGAYSIAGSKGGYSEGILTLTKKTTLYVFVGGQSPSYTSSDSQTSTSVVNGGWNGGGAGVRTSRYNSGDTDGRSFPRGGGGATDISTVTSDVSYSNGRTTRDSASLLARCIVAGGGGGASARYTINTITDTTSETIKTTTVPYSNSSSSRHFFWQRTSISVTEGDSITFTISPTPASKTISFADANNNVLNSTSGTSMTVPSGAAKVVYNLGYNISDGYTENTAVTVIAKKVTSTTSTSTSSEISSRDMQGGGTSGNGQYPGTQTSAGTGGSFGLGASQLSTNNRYCGGGGGGGWYGGGTSQSDSSTSYINYSGGGSGFVNTSSNAASRPSGYTGLQLDSGTTKDGSKSFESTSGDTETGHSGNGYARITVIE